MFTGVVFPQTEFGNDPIAIRDYAQTAEALGYSHIIAYDHVVGANPDRPGGFQGPYTHETAFHEPFVIFGFMAGVTTRIGFAPGIIILPQRQTVLVAKQAATLDVLSGGRLRLGVGILLVAYSTYSLARPHMKTVHGHWPVEVAVGVLNGVLGSNLCRYSGRSPSGLAGKPKPRSSVWDTSRMAG